jgi:hypothetical protein
MTGRRFGHRALALTLSITLVTTLATAVLTTPAAAEQTIGFPTFGGPADPVPDEPAGYTTRGMMQAMYEADLAAGAGQPDTDFWMDALLAREGSDPAGNQLMTRGRALYMYTHSPNVIGFGGQVAYWDNIDGRAAYTITLGDGGYSQDVASRRQTPSYWRQTYTNAGTGFQVEVTKFITNANVAVTNLAITNTGDAAQQLPIQVSSPYTTTPDGDELTGIVDAPNAVTTLFPRLAGDGLAVDGTALAGSVSVAPGQTVQTKVTMGFVTEEIAESLPEYESYRDAAPDEAFTSHVRAYNRWWAENVPYIDVPEEGIKKQIYYRWWIMRFNFLDADAPGNDWQFPVGIEGVTGYNNSIALTVPMFIDELKYLRDPMYAYGTMLSAGEGSRHSRYSDNPGKPTNWNDSYLQYTTDASWRAYQIYGGQPAILRNLARYGEHDATSQLAHRKPPADVEGANPYLLWYCCGFLNGNDADNPSYDFYGRGNERAETAYVHANALATAEIYDLLGEPAKAAQMRELAGNIQQAILDVLWDEESELFLHHDVHTDTLIPWKEINNYYPFTVGLVPNEQPYLNALRLFDDPAEYPIFPFYTANQRDHAARTGGSNNFSQINSTVQFRLLSSVLRGYDTPFLDEQWYKKLLYWNAWATFINGDTRWPDSNEFWFNWNPDAQTFGRSGIHHSMLGSSNWTVIEDVAGLRPRTDDKLELWPIDIDWPHFTVTDLNYRGQDLTIVWNGDAHYPGVPQGYSAYLNGERILTVDRLTHLVWDPATGNIEFGNEPATVLHSAADPDAPAPAEVALTGDRVVDIFQKAGVDIAPQRSVRQFPNLALDATPSASFVDQAEETNAYPATSLAGAIDGATINLPFWGSAGSGNHQDWYELDFGKPTTFSEVKLYFFNDRNVMGVPDQHRVVTDSNRYREPALFTIQVWRDDEGWVDVRDQVKSPTYPRANYNKVAFRSVTAQRMRILMTHREDYGTGLKEVQVFRPVTNPPPRPVNQPPQLVVRQDPSNQVPGQAQLAAVVKDDGLPQATLETNWEVVSGPGLALFDDPTAHNPLLRFSEDGEYVVALTATDGALTTTEQLTITVEGVGTGQVNLAPRANPTCTNTSPWESCDAINLSSDGSTPPQYGTWPTNGDQWVQLEWDQPVRVDSADMWFFQDAPPGADGGVQAPASWNIQYRDGDSWVDVTNPEGFGTALNQFNPASFDPVTTTALRANLIAREGQAAAEGIGVRRWRAYAEQPEAVAPVEVSTSVGELPELPSTVTLVYEGGAELDAAVVWEPVTPEQVANPGTFEVRGLVDTTSLLARATVVVADP